MFYTELFDFYLTHRLQKTPNVQCRYVAISTYQVQLYALALLWKLRMMRCLTWIKLTLCVYAKVCCSFLIFYFLCCASSHQSSTSPSLPGYKSFFESQELVLDVVDNRVILKTKVWHCSVTACTQSQHFSCDYPSCLSLCMCVCHIFIKVLT